MARISLESFAQQISTALGARLVSLVLYGSAARALAEGGEKAGDGGSEKRVANTLLIVADSASADLLALLARPVAAWVAAGQLPPLIFTEREWRQSADAFPVEYEDIREAHRLLAGRDPWQGIRVHREHVRRQLEHELMGKLVHLRQAFAADWNRPKHLAEIVRETRSSFLTMLRAVLRLAGHAGTPQTPEALVREAAALIGFATDGLTEPAAYLEAVTRTAEYVNRLERNPA